MENKIVVISITLIMIFILACQQGVKKEGAMNKAETPKVVSTGEAAVDAVGNDLNSVDSVEKDLNVDNLSDVDSGLTDVQNI